MKLPKRPIQHIRETASFKIFSSVIPNNWIIREVTERDYGIDCYIELVKVNDELSGQLVSIQLKSTDKIVWDKNDKYLLSGIKISTINYWYGFCVPVFIFVVDISNKQVFFVPVKNYIRNHYNQYVQEKLSSFRVNKYFQFKGNEGLTKFILCYYQELHRKEFERNLLTFVVNYRLYINFISENIGNDCFMGIEDEGYLFVKHFYNNLNFICNYLNIDWGIELFEYYEKLGKKCFGDSYELYEAQMEEIVMKLKEKLLPVINRLKKIVIDSEEEYWCTKNIKLYNYIFNINTDRL